ncbi:MAG: TlpA disulfide reductase family protein [Chloroflexota bacterium]
MTTPNQKKAFWQDRSTTFWSLVSMGAVSLCFGVLVCGLIAGVGMMSAFNSLNSADQVNTVIPLGDDVETAQSEADEAAEEASQTEADASEEPASTEAQDTSDQNAEVLVGLTDESPQPPKLGNPAAQFTLKSLDGEVVSLSDFAGQPVIINFWATWCGPCEAEMPDIEAAYLAHKDEGLIVLAVDMAEHPETVRSFVNYYELTFHILIDVDQDVGNHYGARALPTTYFVDRSGNIVHMYFGQMRESDIEVGLRKILP